ncbi:MAG: hypothetical protein E6K81_04915 [Candidatus Eisenbacteria bacterium]|uniref:Peptidase S8/S53 domain-containing protein n=1 Tax=Eiseniibacteriota bacterium TaxID=2212470 RepID=A0A538UBR8_UNCEI|nr:MAG: hypothetical protein E6K81_04915 [Candidatus Eisenbacteria bacterium]
MITATTQVGIKPAALSWWSMNALGPAWRDRVLPPRLLRQCPPVAACVATLFLAAVFLHAPAAIAAPFIWDQDQDRIDDRIETIHVSGYDLAFEQANPLLRKRIDVGVAPAGLVFGVYVEFANPVTTADLLALTALGMPVLDRFEELPVLRSSGSFAQIQAAAALAGVDRVEAVPILYPDLHEGAASIGARDPSGQVFPTWTGMGGAAGEGVVVAILDSGINDAPEGPYPGHESLIGRCVGGADFTQADSLLNTGRDASVNPSDHGGDATRAHGTHVAGIILGNGGATGFATGIAPQARFVDVKVLNDLGVGSGVAEALDWCIHNRARDWGGDPADQGIDVINLSLSSPDASDGNDLAARLAACAVQHDIVVVGSIGNQGRDHFVPSPAAGDRVLAVGALDTQRSALNGDDVFASFSDVGPRAGDGDLDAADEEKPDLLAPGVAVLSADGSLTSDGAQYQRLSGTSMAAAFVSGAAAALRSAFPALTPEQVARVLLATAYRPLGAVPPGLPGADPGWYSPVGFGAVDLYAALLELTQPERSQVRRLELAGSASQITATLRTMRERGAAHFVFERAPEVAGGPGAFAALDSVPAAGDSSLADGSNMSVYVRTWEVPANERGVPFWYRVATTEDQVRWEGPSRRFVSPLGPPVATVEVTVVHDAYDHDLDAAIEVGGSASLMAQETSPPALVYPLPASSAAVASEWVTGASTTGNVAWTFAVDLPAGEVEATLPPDGAHPWRLRVTDGGYLNRVGRITDYRVIWHAAGGDQTFLGGPVPLQTIEGATVYAAAPVPVVGVDGPTAVSRLRAGPNPVPGGGAVTFALPVVPREDLRVYDLAGRAVGRARFTGHAGVWEARWEARDAAGAPLRSGLYFARVQGSGAVRLAVLAR